MQCLIITGEAASAVTLNLYGIIAGIKTPFQTKVDACKNMNIKCPVASGQATSFTAVVFVQEAYPKVRNGSENIKKLV